MFCDGFGFDFEEVGVDGAAGYFGFRRADETEFANSQAAFFVRHRWAEGAAGDRARGVEVAGAGEGGEGGAGLVGGEVVEEGFVVGFGEEFSGGGVAGEVAAQAGAGRRPGALVSR